ncbi:hypothetical protein VKT23_014029 [Stygiomarasmius scandens]|uniref:Uncharacterized protein n=1 Tax=Marasmiellus scandens TaxID=2682957 RepID=A0ABR1J1Q6_9AGAR
MALIFDASPSAWVHDATYKLGSNGTIAMAFSGDGCSLAIVSRHSTTFWNVDTTKPRLLRSFASLSSPALAVIHFEQDTFITGHARGEVRLIAPHGDRQTVVLRNRDNNRVESLALKVNKLLAVRTTAQIELYEIPSSESARFIGVIPTPTSNVDGLYCTETVPESMYWVDDEDSVNLVVSYPEKHVIVWHVSYDSQTSVLLVEEGDHLIVDGVVSVDMAPDGLAILRKQRGFQLIRLGSTPESSVVIPTVGLATEPCFIGRAILEKNVGRGHIWDCTGRLVKTLSCTSKFGKKQTHKIINIVTESAC